MIKGGRLYRLTFSKSLADHICRLAPGYTVERRKFVLGSRLVPNETSPSGLYAIVKEGTDWALRITTFQQLAESWRHSSRYIAGCWLI